MCALAASAASVAAAAAPASAAHGAPVALSGTEPTEASAATDWAPVVADIRESYLGPPGEQARYATHTQRLGRAVQRLAAELYADDHHWVFDLTMFMNSDPSSENDEMII